MFLRTGPSPATQVLVQTLRPSPGTPAGREPRRSERGLPGEALECRGSYSGTGRPAWETRDEGLSSSGALLAWLKKKEGTGAGAPEAPELAALWCYPCFEDRLLAFVGLQHQKLSYR